MTIIMNNVFRIHQSKNESCMGVEVPTKLKDCDIQMCEECFRLES